MKGIEGSTLGRYELRRRVARGGMSEVYLGYDRRVRRPVAIKVLYGSDEPFVRRFEREASAVGALSHNHILPLYDFGEQRPWYYLVMPYVEGGTLRDYLLKRERLTLEEAASFLYQIASALQYAHDHGVVHRDVKPSNILLRPDGHAYLVDFGLAKARIEAESLTHAGAMVGTPEYMAPEQSNGQNDYRSDIYSLGIILYQMLTGRVPFTAEWPVAVSLKHIQSQPTPPRQLNSEISQPVEDVILKVLSKDPNERYQEAEAFSAAYREALQQTYRQRAEIEASVPQVERNDLTVSPHGAESTSSVAQSLPTTGQEIAPSVETDLFPLVKEPVSALSSISTPSINSADQEEQERKRIHHLYRTFLVLLFLVLLGTAVPLSLIWQVHSVETSRQDVQTLAIQQRATAIAVTQAKVQATLAAQAHVQATAGITSAIGAGNVLYSYDLRSPSGDWIDDGYQCFFSAQGYHVHTGQPHTAAWCYSNQQQFSDVVLTAQAQLLRGDIYGLVFRLSPLSKAFYALELNKQGDYRFVRAQGSDPQNWLTLIDWTHSSAIVSGYGHTNTFLVVATGAHFRFYINQQLIVTTFSDTTYTSGSIGFLVGGDSSGGTEAVFTDVWVFQK